MPDSEQKQIKNQPNLNDLISLSEAALLTGFTDRHIRKLVSEQKLWGIKLGRNWFTTTQAIKEYKAMGHKPGPKTKI